MGFGIGLNQNSGFSRALPKTIKILDQSVVTHFVFSSKSKQTEDFQNKIGLLEVGLAIADVTWNGNTNKIAGIFLMSLKRLEVQKKCFVA